MRSKIEGNCRKSGIGACKPAINLHKVHFREYLAGEFGEV
jgi:hypothetical protein